MTAADSSLVRLQPQVRDLSIIPTQTPDSDMLPIEDTMDEQQRLGKKTNGGEIEQETQSAKARRVEPHRLGRKANVSETEQDAQSLKARRVATVTLRTGAGTTVCSNEETEATTVMYDFPYIYDSGDFPVEA